MKHYFVEFNFNDPLLGNISENNQYPIYSIQEGESVFFATIREAKRKKVKGTVVLYDGIEKLREVEV